MFTKPEEGGVQSCMGLGVWSHIDPSMHNFTSPKKVKLVVFTFRESIKNLKRTPWVSFS
jgi:hypothetical protein